MSDAIARGGGSSFLVRLWREPRREAGAGAPPRVFVRDLRSGEERYLKDLAGLAEYLERRQPPRPADDQPAGAGSRRRAG